MTPKAKRQKAAMLQNHVKDKVLKNYPHLKKKDVTTAAHGMPGPDIILSKVARKLVGINFECKAHNKMKTVYDWHKQSARHAKKLVPTVVMRMNAREPLIVLNLDDFFKLIKD